MEKDIIYNTDCLVGMAELPDNCIDAIIADLPYGILNKGNKAVQWDKIIPLDKLWKHYNRISKIGCPIILFSQGMFTAQLIMSQPKKWRYNLVWEKGRVSGYLNAKRMPLRKHEDIVVFYDSQPVYNPQMRLCLPSERNHSRRDVEKFTNRCYGNMKAVPVRMANDKYPTSIIQIPKEHRKGCFYHPTQKPVALIEYLIRTYTNPGDLILDNAIGSGTTAVAAVNTGRHFIGYEIQPEYCEIANRRIEEAYTEFQNHKRKS